LRGKTGSLVWYWLDWQRFLSYWIIDFLCELHYKFVVIKYVFRSGSVHGVLSESVSLSLQDDHLAASAAHVACCMSTSACAGAKNWFIVVFVFAIYSVFLGLPGLLPVFM
jgi:hypothetical protein